MKSTHPSQRNEPSGPTAEASGRVGYRSPPRQHRFQKGSSGNPRGKRKGTPNLLAVFKRVVMKKIKVPVGGEIRTITIADYVLRKNYDAATVKRNKKAMNNMLLLAEIAGHLLSAEDRERIGAPITQSQALATEDFEALFGSPVPDGTSGSKH